MSELSKSWDGYKPSPIEVFHGEAMKQFHAGARFPVNETFVNGIRFLNGIEVNCIIADFKSKIMKEYGITSAAIKIEADDKKCSYCECVCMGDPKCLWCSDGRCTCKNKKGGL